MHISRPFWAHPVHTEQWHCHFNSKKEGKDQESIKSSTTPDPGYQWERENFSIRHYKLEPKGHPFPSR